MSIPQKMDDPNNRFTAHREVKEKTGSPTSKANTDIVRRRAKALEAIERRQKEEAEKKEQIAAGENKDINSSESPFIRTKEYEDMRVKILQKAEGRMKENTVPDSLNVEQGLSRERQIELSQRALNEQKIRDSMQKPAVDTKSESDTSSAASDNPHASIYQREIKQIQELIDTERTVYAYFNRREGSVYITDNMENARAKFGDDAANLQLGDQLNGIRRIDLEYARMGIQDENYRLKPELDITASQVEKSQDRKADAIEAKEAEGKTTEMVRGSAFTKLGSEIRNQQVWSESVDSWKNPKMDFKVMKENEPFAFKNLEDDTVIITWDNNYSRPNETPVPLNYAERIINENGIDGVRWDLPTVYALKSEPKNLGDKLEVIVTDHEETADALKEKWGYRSLGELKIRDQDTKTNNDQRLTSVKDFVGADYADKLPVWMQKDDIRIGDFIEYQRNKSLTPQEFMQLVQGQPLERETIPADARKDMLEPGEHDDQGAVLKEKLSRVEKTFAGDVKGKEFNKLKEDLDDLYGRISKRSLSKEVSEQAEELKERADTYPIQIEAFFKLKEVTPSLNEQYTVHYNRMVKDMQESVEFMKEALSQSHRQDIPTSSKFEAKEDFISSVENTLGNTGKIRQFSEKVYDDLKAKGVDQNRMRLSMAIIERNKENITAWLEDGQKTESDINGASRWLMNQVDQLLQRRNDSSTNEPYADATRQFRREMGPRGTGETMA